MTEKHSAAMAELRALADGDMAEGKAAAFCTALSVYAQTYERAKSCESGVDEETIRRGCMKVLVLAAAVAAAIAKTDRPDLTDRSAKAEFEGLSAGMWDLMEECWSALSDEGKLDAFIDDRGSAMGILTAALRKKAG